MGQMSSKKKPDLNEIELSAEHLEPAEASFADNKQVDPLRTTVEDRKTKPIIPGEQPVVSSSTDELLHLTAIFSDSIKLELPLLHVEKRNFIADIEASAHNLNKTPVAIDFSVLERSEELLRKSTLATPTPWINTLPFFQTIRKQYQTPFIFKEATFLAPNEYADIILVALGQALVKYTLVKNYAIALSRYRERFPAENNAFLKALGFFVIAYFHQASITNYVETAYIDYAQTIYTALLQIICLSPLPAITCHISASNSLPETDNKKIRRILAEVDEEVTEKIRDNQRQDVKKCLDDLLIPLTLGVEASKVVFLAHAIAKLKNIPLSDLNGDLNFFITELHKVNDQYRQHISSRVRPVLS